MIKIAFPAYDINIGYLVLGEDVTARIQNDVRPVKATVIEAGPPWYRRVHIEVTFLDEEQAWEWMSSEGMDVNSMFSHLGSHTRAA